MPRALHTLQRSSESHSAFQRAWPNVSHSSKRLQKSEALKRGKEKKTQKATKRKRTKDRTASNPASNTLTLSASGKKLSEIRI